ncbi:MAG: Holliday junction resolvase Hjc [Acidilobaceae archaeon]
MSSRKRRSYEAENELANILWSLGFAVVRGPASGSGVRRRFQPDLVAAKNGKILVFEIKRCSRDETALYIESSQVLGLQEWAKRAGGEAFIAIRLPGGEWRIHDVGDLEITKGGNFKLKDLKKGVRLRDLLERIEPKSKSLTEFLESYDSSEHHA